MKIIDYLDFQAPKLTPEERERMDRILADFKRMVRERDIKIVIPRPEPPRRP